jgi:hypothetical protein
MTPLMSTEQSSFNTADDELVWELLHADQLRTMQFNSDSSVLEAMANSTLELILATGVENYSSDKFLLSLDDALESLLL